MEISEMRKKISRVYPGEKWQNRVKNMDKKQVFAVYMRFLNDGKFEKPKKEVKKQEKYEQMTLDEFLKNICEEN